MMLKYFLIMALGLSISNQTFSSTPKSMICHDTEFGAGHFKLILPDLNSFFLPRDQKPPVSGEFWIKGDHFTGMLEAAAFMPDWRANTGWYRSSPSPLEFSLCPWRKCPVRKIKLMVLTRDQIKAEGQITFLFQTSDKKREHFERKLNCELK